jgi:hypothetical protein
MSTETPTASAPLEPAAEVTPRGPQLWNPRAAAWWSLMFSPAFGAYLLMLNWQNLGKPEKAAEARTWFQTVCGFFALNLIVEVFCAAHGTENPIPNSIGLALTATWYVLSARPQEKYVDELQHGDYVRKAWPKPLSIALAVTLVYAALTVCINKLLVM